MNGSTRSVPSPRLPLVSPSERAASAPLVSVILTTKNRPQLLTVAFECYRLQSYAHRELIVIDDGDIHPVDDHTVTALGGRLIVVLPGTVLGAKLNTGLAEARGSLCMKMDDDDWYAPTYIETMVSSLQTAQRDVCRPTFAFLAPFLFFEIEKWRLRRAPDHNIPGATLFFAREDWEHRPFRALPFDEDLWFVLDQVNAGVIPLNVHAIGAFAAIRHPGSPGERGHTWTHQMTGQPLEDFLEERKPYRASPESFFPEWVLKVYRDMHHDSHRTPQRVRLP